ncbi:hypothetical protein, partial [Raoultella ornithinolytica]|uniref:hypothetical protein n=1 Tax=Raoultella ornithinolytica TaxID=54291 RepID=UPI00384DE093
DYVRNHTDQLHIYQRITFNRLPIFSNKHAPRKRANCWHPQNETSQTAVAMGDDERSTTAIPRCVSINVACWLMPVAA